MVAAHPQMHNSSFDMLSFYGAPHFEAIVLDYLVLYILLDPLSVRHLVLDDLQDHIAYCQQNRD